MIKWFLSFFRKNEVVEQKPPPPPEKKKITKRPKVKKCPVTNKTIYLEREIASRERDKLASNTKDNYLRIYTCEFCGHWHLTHRRLNRN